MTNSLTVSADKIAEANKGSSSQGMILQNYCNSVIQQPKVDLQGFKNLTKYQDEINSGLGAAQGHANNYLNTIQPAIITNIANIANYYAINNAVPTSLPPGATEAQWLDILKALRDQAEAYQKDASGVVTKLNGFRTDLGSDTANFAGYVSQLNAAVNGDKGMLSAIDDELSSIDAKIAGAIAGIVLSGLAIAGGVFMAAVGGVASFVTAGTSGWLVAGGVAIVAAGVGGEVASALVLASLNDHKATLLQDKSTLTSEVNLATGISGAIGSLNSQASAALTAATQMENAWSFLAADLDTLAGNLKSGITNTGTLRSLFLNAANGATKTVIDDTNIIKAQMTGVQNLTAPANTNISTFIVDVANQHAA